jgi:hypothetical protein
MMSADSRGMLPEQIREITLDELTLTSEAINDCNQVMGDL